ncbi:molybdopterin converting factor subunit 1 [Cytobacillus sp. FJAT-54145]|uniref:Molybdopterin synthase sulfur carrier subunit n=1 Tax=Cytobacillus spartinae TaxID=3299023 RepID=A0ABW6KGA8_9BACI
MNKILFFAHLKDVTEEEFIMMDVSGKSVAEVKEILLQKYDRLKLDTVMTAVNEEFATNDETIKPGDEIAFIPPVSGG